MTQQVPPPPSKLKKGFLIVGVVLLIMGFFFFYWASRVSWDYVTTYPDDVNLLISSAGYSYEFGSSREYPVKPYSLIMQPDDFLTVSYPLSTFTNGTVCIVIWETSPASQVLDYSPAHAYSAAGWLGFKNDQSSEIVVSLNLAISNEQNVTVSVTTSLHHYERPHWILFAVGVVLSSLALVPIFKSRKQA